MHHGTIMFDSNLDMVERSLKVPEDKFLSKGFKSVRSRVTNVKPHLSQSISTIEFMDHLQGFMSEEFRLISYDLRKEDLDAVRKLQKEVYDRWEWNYGESPNTRL